PSHPELGDGVLHAQVRGLVEALVVEAPLVGDLAHHHARARFLPTTTTALVGGLLRAGGGGERQCRQEPEHAQSESHRWILLPRGPTQPPGPSGPVPARLSGAY